MMLEVHGLTAYYGQTQALHGIDFGLEQGGITTLLGANGAGKTTTLRALCGMVRTGGDENFAMSDESLELAWVSIRALAEASDTDESLRRMARKWLEQSAS